MDKMMNLFDQYENALEHYKSLYADPATNPIDLEIARAEMNTARRKFSRSRRLRLVFISEVDLREFQYFNN